MIDYEKPILPQLREIEDTKGIEAVQTEIYNMTEDQRALFVNETNQFLDVLISLMELDLLIGSKTRWN